MRRFGIFIGIAVLVIAAILVVAFSRFDVNHYRTQIETEMGQQLGRKVALGNMKLKLLPFRLRVENFTISEDPNFGGQTPFLKADIVDLSMKLLPLLNHKVEIDAIKMQRPTAEVVKNAKGIWNFSSIGQGRQQTSSGKTTGVVMEGDVILHDSQVSVTNLRMRASRKVYDHIDITLRGFAPGKPFSIDAVARISSQGGQEISLQGKVGPRSEIAAERTPFDGTISLNRVAISNLRNFLTTPVLAKTDGIVSGETDIKTENGKLQGVGSVKLENVRLNGLDVGYPITAQYNLSADPVTDVITIVSSNIALGSAPVSVSGSVNLQPSPAELDLKVGSEGASIGEVTRLASAFGLAPDATVTGQMDSDLQIRGPADNPELNGRVSARDLRIAMKEVRLPVQIASVDLTITPKEIRSNNFEVRSGNTTASARFGLAQYTSKSPKIDFAFRTLNANLPEAIAIGRAYGAKGLSGINGSGTLSLDIHASGPVQSVRSSEIMRLLNGNANMNLSNVHIAGLDVEHELSSIGGFKKSVPNRGGTNIERLTGRFLITNGIAQTNDLRGVLNVGNVAAAGTANLSNHALNLRATAVLSKAASHEAGGSSVLDAVKPVVENSHGELVIPGRITGTFENPKFEPDMQQFSLMKLKGIVPTSDNPFGVLGTVLGQDKQNETKPHSQNPAQGAEKFLGRILGKK
ncbi:MAG TPA: translocation/assembly module TamB domain-containing protein [Terriglobia bacterium]|nr:translocation/assembly module TamB domain-containing protein [Terriglobia bacterium]